MDISTPVSGEQQTSQPVRNKDKRKLVILLIIFLVLLVLTVAALLASGILGTGTQGSGSTATTSTVSSTSSATEATTTPSTSETTSSSITSSNQLQQISGILRSVDPGEQSVSVAAKTPVTDSSGDKVNVSWSDGSYELEISSKNFRLVMSLINESETVYHTDYTVIPGALIQNLGRYRYFGTQNKWKYTNKSVGECEDPYDPVTFAGPCGGEFIVSYPGYDYIVSVICDGSDTATCDSIMMATEFTKAN